MEFIILIPLVLVCLTVHEFAHAITAYKLGDSTPKMQGRVTLNPLAHLDPLGTLMIIVTTIGGIGFGWGKPVTFNPANLKHPKRDIGLVAFAGPLSNLLMAVLTTLAGSLILNTFPVFGTTLVSFILINIALAVFNLIPIYPLDGFDVVLSLLPNSLSSQFAETSKYGMFVLIALIFTGATSTIINPVVSYVLSLLSVFL